MHYPLNIFSTQVLHLHIGIHAVLVYSARDLSTSLELSPILSTRMAEIRSMTFGSAIDRSDHGGIHSHNNVTPAFVLPTRENCISHLFAAS